MGHYGRKKMKFDGDSDRVRTTSCEVTDVTKPLEKGNEVHFGKECSIKNVLAGYKILMRKKGGSCVIDIVVIIEEEQPFSVASLNNNERLVAGKTD